MVTAVETTVRKLFQGTTQYQVPLYQRPYQWGKKDWKTLWSDVMELMEDREAGIQRTHFIGSLVLAQSPTSVAGGVSRHLVVDGQQRLTTISILLAALRDLNVEDGKLYSQINEEYLINRFEEGDARLKLLPTQIDRPTYRPIVGKEAIELEDNQISSAYRFFIREIKKLISDDDWLPCITRLYETVTDGLSLVSISTHPDDNVHRIFQSLNNTGLKLTQGDLLRNYIFMLLPNRGEEIYHRYWRPMQETLENSQLEDLFWIDLARTHATAKISDTFFHHQKRLDAMKKEDDVAQEVKRLAELAQVYRLILHPHMEDNPTIALRLRRLQELDMTVPHSLVLEVLRRRQNGLATEVQVERALLIIESFLIRRIFMAKATQGLNRTFRESVSAITGDSPVDEEIHQWLSQGRKYYYSDAEILETLPEIAFFQNGKPATRKVLLQWLEEEHGSKEPVRTASLTIEHVMPQTLSEEWVDYLQGRYPGENIYALHEKYVHTIGNLTLTGYNSELSNRDFRAKQEKYSESGIRLSSDIAVQEEWGFDEIKARTERMITRILMTWPAPLF